MKGVQCLCPPKFWSALSKPGPAHFHQLSAGWKEYIWKPGTPLYHGIFVGVFRPRWKEKQHSPALGFHSPPERLPSSWAQQSSTGFLDTAHLMEWAGWQDQHAAARGPRGAIHCSAHLAPCCGKIHLQRVGKACLHCWNKNSTFNSHICSFAPCGMITRTQSGPKSPFPPVPTALEWFRGHSAFCSIALITTQHYNWYVKAY